MRPTRHLLFFCIQNSVFSIRNTSLYGSQPSSVVFACKTATLGPELQVCIGPRPHLCFFCINNSDFSTRIASLYGSQPSSVIWYTHNSDIMTWINSLHWSQTSPVDLCMQNNVISIRNTSLYWSQLSSAVFPAKQRLFDQNYNSLWVPDLTHYFLHSIQLL